MSKAEKIAAKERSRAWNQVAKADRAETVGRPEESLMYRVDAAERMLRLGMENEADAQFRRAAHTHSKLAWMLDGNGDTAGAGRHYGYAAAMLGRLKKPDEQDWHILQLLRGNGSARISKVLEASDPALQESEALALMHTAVNVAATGEEKKKATAEYNLAKDEQQGVRRGPIAVLYAGSATFGARGAAEASTEVSDGKAVAMVDEHISMGERAARRRIYTEAANHFLMAYGILMKKGMEDEAAPKLERAIGVLEEGLDIAVAKSRDNESIALAKRLIGSYKDKRDSAGVARTSIRLADVYERNARMQIKRKVFGAAKHELESAIGVLCEAGLDTNTAELMALLADVNSKMS